MQSFDFSPLGFSRLFTEFIVSNPFFESVFPTNDTLTNFDFWLERAQNFKGREGLDEAITTTMSSVHLTELQSRNLQLLQQDTTLAAVTGQQVGFLGGAIYTLLKAHSTIRIAEKFTEAGLTTVPVFWIEDNDADSAEAAKTYILNSLNEPVEFACTDTFTTSIPVAERIFTADILDKLNQLEITLPPTEFTAETMTFLREIYKEGASWTQAFTQLLQKFLGKYGVLFISANVARNQGLFKKITLQELSQPTATKAAVELMSEKLTEENFHIQAVASEPNLFLHEGSERSKIKWTGSEFTAFDTPYSTDELLKKAEDFPELFSPNVVLRPVIQDAILPTIVYVAGPGEIAYLSELHNVYKMFKVQAPAVIPRHSATFAPPAVLRFIEKNNFDAQFFMRPWRMIEHDLVEMTADTTGEALFTKSSLKIKDIFSAMSMYATSIDPSLGGAVGAGERQTEKVIEDLHKRIASAQKKRHAALFEKSRETMAVLFPDGKLQERVLSPIVWSERFGIDTFSEAMRIISNENPTSHFFSPLRQEKALFL
ncbi:MAG: bacillithiol biosynthesis cysteine-adding enzyme BshC [Ignavibacteria bacterium]|nr:bacillithiol biosynthesis cysteine-adding enzyme BshC [Ignavibacteria bacterium]